MLVLRPTVVFVITFIILAAVDLLVVSVDELAEHTYTEVLASDMYVLVIPAAVVVALVEWLVRRKKGAGEP
jgi:hypothetical protein